MKVVLWQPTNWAQHQWRRWHQCEALVLIPKKYAHIPGSQSKRCPAQVSFAMREQLQSKLHQFPPQILRFHSYKEGLLLPNNYQTAHTFKPTGWRVFSCYKDNRHYERRLTRRSGSKSNHRIVLALV